MKRCVLFMLGVFLCSIWPTKAFAAEISLQNPINRPAYYDTARLQVGWDVTAKRFDIRLSLGYYDAPVAKTGWNETRDWHKIIENIPAVPDNPDTLENEAKPAKPMYDNFKALVKATDPNVKQLDVLILELVQKLEPKFVGTIE